jgi:hypothetical protein
MDARSAHIRIDKMETRVELLEKSIAENTRITQEVADNTAELVEIAKGAKIFRKLILAIAPLCVIGWGFYQWLMS